MKSFQIKDDFGLDNLTRVDAEKPSCERDDVLVEIDAVSLNFRDLMTVEGTYNPDQPLPLIPCSDAVGTVREVGADVSNFSVGDRVIPIFAQAWQDGPLTAEKRSSTLGGPLPGTLAEYQTFSPGGLVQAPDSLDDVQAATLPCAGVTAWTALTEFGDVTAGDRVLLLGTGGVSTFGLEVAKTLGAEVIITSSRDEKLEVMERRGADHTINYEEHPDWHETVMALTDGEGVDCVLEVGGEDTLPKSLQCVNCEGSIQLIGVLSGGEPKFNLGSVIMKRTTVQGILVGSRENLREFCRAIRQNDLEPVIDKTFSFEEAPEAFKRMRDGNHLGKIVIEI